MPNLELVCLIYRGDLLLLRAKAKELRISHPFICGRNAAVMSGDTKHVFTNKSGMSVVLDLSESSVFSEDSE